MRDIAIERQEIHQWLACHDPSRDLGDRRTDRLGDERDGPARPRIDLDQIDDAVLDRELAVHQPFDAERQSELPRLALDLADDLRLKTVRRERTGAVA